MKPTKIDQTLRIAWKISATFLKEAGKCTNVSMICSDIFEAAVKAKRSRSNPSNGLFSSAELDWFSRNSYNLGMRKCTVWVPRQTLRLLKTCIEVLSLTYRLDIES